MGISLDFLEGINWGSEQEIKVLNDGNIKEQYFQFRKQMGTRRTTFSMIRTNQNKCKEQ